MAACASRRDGCGMARTKPSQVTTGYSVGCGASSGSALTPLASPEACTMTHYITITSNSHLKRLFNVQICGTTRAKSMPPYPPPPETTDPSYKPSSSSSHHLNYLVSPKPQQPSWAKPKTKVLTLKALKPLTALTPNPKPRTPNLEP